MTINQYFQKAIEATASDLHLIVDKPPILRVDGELKEIEKVPLDRKVMKEILDELLSVEQKKRFEEERDYDFSYPFNDWRFRINLHFQRGEVGLAARLIPKTVPSPESIGLNETIYSLTHLHQGLILVTGPSGCGKSTTLATMIDIINQERRAHIITIEDPIEYVYKDKQSIIEQREVGSDTLFFAKGLKYVLRQNPNVILVGEMRDLETVQAVLTAAETGHLVFSTLHTPSAADAVERIIDMFEGARQRQVLVQLAATLKAVIAQQLLPKIGGGLIAAREIMINTPAIANLIRENKIAQIQSAIQTGGREGMVTMEMAVKRLYNDELIEDVKRFVRDYKSKAW